MSSAKVLSIKKYHSAKVLIWCKRNYPGVLRGSGWGTYWERTVTPSCRAVTFRTWSDKQMVRDECKLGSKLLGQTNVRQKETDWLISHLVRTGTPEGAKLSFTRERNMPSPYNLLPALAHLFIKMKKLANASTLQVCAACSEFQTEHLTSLATKKPRSSKAKPCTLGSSVQNPDPLAVKVTLWSCAPTNVCQGVCKIWVLNNSHLSVKPSYSFDGKHITGLRLTFATWTSPLFKSQIVAWHFNTEIKNNFTPCAGLRLETTKLRFMPEIDPLYVRLIGTVW